MCRWGWDAGGGTGSAPRLGGCRPLVVPLSWHVTFLPSSRSLQSYAMRVPFLSRCESKSSLFFPKQRHRSSSVLRQVFSDRCSPSRLRNDLVTSLPYQNASACAWRACGQRPRRRPGYPLVVVRQHGVPQGGTGAVAGARAGPSAPNPAPPGRHSAPVPVMGPHVRCLLSPCSGDGVGRCANRGSYTC
jgi:hypothetical protein